MEELTRYGAGPGGLSARNSVGPVAVDPRSRGGEGLVDVLDRVLDKGVVIAGDIQINLLDIELLTIKVRLLIASADKAKEMGIDWWARDPHLSSGADSKGKQGKLDNGSKGKEADENKALRERVERLEAQLKALTDQGGQGGQGKERSAARRG